MSLDRPPLPSTLSHPDDGGRVDDLGHRPIVTTPNSADDLHPIPGVVTRPMLGGVRTAGYRELLRDAPRFHGGYITVGNRPSVVILAPEERSNPSPAGNVPSMRVPPPSDPLGSRMCANAAATK